MPAVLDYSGWRPTIAQLNSAGIEGVSRYLSWPDQSWKVITKPEYDSLINAGFVVTLNWEWHKATWRDGASGGFRDGKEARRQARALGYPDSCVIIQSVDTSVPAADVSLALDYQRGFNDGGGCGPQGMYGTAMVMQWAWAAGLITVAWQTAARAWEGNGPDSPVAALIQTTEKPYGQFPPAAYDHNDVRKPYWGAQNTCLFGYRCDLAH